MNITEWPRADGAALGVPAHLEVYASDGAVAIYDRANDRHVVTRAPLRKADLPTLLSMLKKSAA